MTRLALFVAAAFILASCASPTAGSLKPPAGTVAAKTGNQLTNALAGMPPAQRAQFLRMHPEALRSIQASKDPNLQRRFQETMHDQPESTPQTP